MAQPRRSQGNTLSALAPSFASLSLAEAKLQRQTKRIEDAEAALAATPPLQPMDKERRKPKAWHKFDFTHDTPSPSNGFDASVAEVRLNRFHAAHSRASSLTRSMSTVSQRTSDTAADRDRHDSLAMNDNGFIVHTGRRRNKRAGTPVYPDEPKLATVEASYDEREVLKVFGVPLPGPGYIDQNIGDKNGMLQFVQHPNGDVSAHQWSTARFQWENIGQYSNIRKRVEGQLASDRLKGQTGLQTLQMQTLLYFRAVARQREASLLGLPFGAKEIEALLPGLKPVPLPLKTPIEVLIPHPPAKSQALSKSPGTNPASPVALPLRPRQSTASLVDRGEPKPSILARHPSVKILPAANRFANVVLPQTPAAPKSMFNAPLGSGDPFYPAALNYRNIYGTSLVSSEQSPKPVYNSFGAITPLRPDVDYGSARKVSGASSILTPTHDGRPKPFSPLVQDPSAFREEMQRMTHQAEKRNSQSNLALLNDQQDTLDDATIARASPCALRPIGSQKPLAYQTPQQSRYDFTASSVQIPCQASSHQPAPGADANPSPQLLDLHHSVSPPVSKPDNVKDELVNWLHNAQAVRRQQEWYDRLKASDMVTRPEQCVNGKKDTFDMTQLWMPVLQNLSAYVQGPEEKRRDYFSPWVQAPEYAIDRNAIATESSYDPDWVTPPAGVGKGPHFQSIRTPTASGTTHSTSTRPTERLKFGDFSSVSPRPAGLEHRLHYGAF